ncbi:hypothetical protein [Spongiibacter sp.]|uniref:hypothetical protein n=1 Tax=Spongiibacter sp. TaxID=2024860 RepID=UPI000C3D3C7F|nr:hypothetical protein [Spongiibacter sp.]MAY37882.1 hypothetical protein [Spongiibacter sp.]|tara:strand:+ start:177 stop:467 length:291 start_codon:yes stop_codon:yes gene_type:complete
MLGFSVVVAGKFKKLFGKQVYSGDLFSNDLKRYQIEVISDSAREAYLKMIDEAADRYGVSDVRYVEIYKGALDERAPAATPVLTHHESTEEPSLLG